LQALLLLLDLGFEGYNALLCSFVRLLLLILDLGYEAVVHPLGKVARLLGTLVLRRVAGQVRRVYSGRTRNQLSFKLS
jgi:hypothetical protein